PPRRPEPKATEASADIWHDPWLMQQLAVDGFDRKAHPRCYDYLRLHPSALEARARETDQTWMDAQLRFREALACTSARGGGR
ncbi:MAG: hypothetical protein ACPGUV_11075, partial [Polyangiales bacterium]